MIIFDLETNGLLKDVNRVHCLCLYDTETGEYESYSSNECNVVFGVRRVQKAKTLIGHNIIGYDLPVLRKVYPFFDFTGQVIDTLVLSRVFHSNILDIDKAHKWRYMPLQTYGRHTLESYGYRLGCYKGDFGKSTDWQEWSEEMQIYCEKDVQVTKKLWEHFDTKYLTSSN